MAEKRTIELEVKESGFKSLKAQIKEANIELIKAQENFGDYSNEAIKAAKNVAGLKDKIAEAAETAALFDPGKKFQVATGAITAAAGAMSAYEGAMGLLGVESEQLEKAMLRVQSAMALSQGLSAVADARKDFARLGAVVGDVFSKMTAASKAFLVGGIGLIIAAVGLLVANWDNLTKSASKAAEEQRRLAAQTKAVAEAAKEQREAVSKESAEFATLIARLKDTNAGSKEREDLIKKVNAQYGTTLKNLKDETAFQSSLNSELANYLEYQKAKYILQSREELITKNLAKQDELNAKINKDKKELIRLTKEQEKADKEAGKASQQTVTGGGTAGGFGGATTYQESYEKAAKKSSLAVKEQQQSIKDLEQQLESAKQRFENYGSAANNAQNNIDKLTNGGKKYVEQVEKETKVVTDATEKINKNAIEGRLELKTIKEVDNLDSLDMLKEQNDAEALINRDARDKELAAEKQAALDKAAAKTAAFQAGVDLTLKYLKTFADVTNSINSLMNANDSERLKNENITAKESEKIKRRMFDRDKKLRIVQTIIDTASNVVQSVRNGGGIPTGIPFGIAAGAMGALQVAAISKTTFDSGGSGGGGGGNIGGGAPTAPNFNIVGNSGINQLAELGGQPIQAYVVSGEVTSAQALDRNRIQNATF